MARTIEDVIVGMVVMLAGTLPRNAFFAANLRHAASIPWAVPVTAAYLWVFWRYLGGAGPPQSTVEARRIGLRANRVSGRLWMWAMIAGGLGIVALVLGLRVANRMVTLPHQVVPGLADVPRTTVLALLIMAAPVAGVVEEAAFRGYMQGAIERRYGIVVAIVLSGTMFAVAHLDYTLILWPYYLSVAAIYGVITWRTNSILPAVVLHTAGNLYSNFTLWRDGRAEWQSPTGPATLIWTTGADASFWTTSLSSVVVAAVMVWAFRRLARAAREAPIRDVASSAG